MQPRITHSTHFSIVCRPTHPIRFEDFVFLFTQNWVITIIETQGQPLRWERFVGTEPCPIIVVLFIIFLLPYTPLICSAFTKLVCTLISPTILALIKWDFGGLLLGSEKLEQWVLVASFSSNLCLFSSHLPTWNREVYKGGCPFPSLLIVSSKQLYLHRNIKPNLLTCVNRERGTSELGGEDPLVKPSASILVNFS